MKERSELSTQTNRSVTQICWHDKHSCVTSKCHIHPLYPAVYLTCYPGPASPLAALPLCQSRPCGLIYASVVSLQSSLTSQKRSLCIVVPLTLKKEVGDGRHAGYPKCCHKNSYPPNLLWLSLRIALVDI